MILRRYEGNPVLKPKSIHGWEAVATFNGCPVKKENKVYLVYRALSLPHYHSEKTLSVSNIGIAVSKNGLDFHDRKLLIYPTEEWDRYGCEDPRVTYFEGKYYIFYTALSNYPPKPDDIRIGVAITEDLKRIEEKHLVTNFNSKAMALFSERIGGKIWAVLTVHTDRPPAQICLASFRNKEEMLNREYWNNWYYNFKSYSLPLLRSPKDHVEVGAPPLKTKAGWLLIYSYIQNYFDPPNRLFTVEAVLLDLKNPFKIIGRTKYPLLTPEEYYERIGIVSDVVFPSGIVEVDDKTLLYYGAADTTCCVAFLNLEKLIGKLIHAGYVPKFRRAETNPIIIPDPSHKWESKATFNPAAIYLNDQFHIIYRAMSDEYVSVLGYASSKDGINIDYRHPEPIYVPRKNFESKGCEDPRVTLIDDKIYMCYTAYDGITPRVALTWINVEDFLNMDWKWAEPVLISPPNMMDKNACIFPEKVIDPGSGEERYMIIHRLGEDITTALVETLEFDGETWIDAYRWITPRRGYWDCVKIGAAAPPLKTKDGWIMLYHGVDKNTVYRVGAVLLDRENPLEVIARTEDPIFEPEENYELFGCVNNVVFPCGAVMKDEKIYMYYGGADRVVGVATIEVKEIIEYLLK